MFARPLDWPDWVDDASPIGWTPAAPIEDWTLASTAGVGAAVVVLLVLGSAAFRQRDLTTG